jgi:hypothetical protein
VNHLIPLTHQAPALIAAAGERAQMRFLASSSTCRPHPQHGGWTPSSTMRILSSAEKCRRVARRMSFKNCVAGSLTGMDFCLIFAP